MRVCMVAYTFYEVDNRVRRYAEALAKRGDLVDVIVLRREGQSSRDFINGVHVFRIQRRVINERSKFTYLAKLVLFFARSLVSLTREHIKSRYSLIHIHSVPDFEVFVAILPKLTGSKIILDIHDIMPEFYVSKFNVSQSSLIFKLLVGVERISAAFSDHVIVANHIWQKRLEARSVKESKCTTILNCPDKPIFSRHGRTRKDNKFIILYPGTFNYHQGLDIALRAFALMKDQVPLAEFHIYGRGDQLEFLRSLISDLGLENRVFLKAMLPFNQINAVIENADLGIVPKRNNVFGNEAFSTKILEFMALGVPVIIPDTMIDRHYFNDSVAEFFHANDERSLADAMLRMIKHPELRQELARNAGEFVKKYAWEENKAGYLDLVDALVYSQNGRELAQASVC